MYINLILWRNEGMEKDVGITVFQLFFVDKDLQFIQMFILAWEQDV